MTDRKISIKEAKREIMELARSQHGGYWSNIIACNLKMVAEEHGDAAANLLIEECGLEGLGWSKKELS